MKSSKPIYHGRAKVKVAESRKPAPAQPHEPTKRRPKPVAADDKPGLLFGHQPGPWVADMLAMLARRFIRAYHDIIASGKDVVGSLTDLELIAVRSMLHEMWDSMRSMDVGNVVLFIDEELERRATNGPTMSRR